MPYVRVARDGGALEMVFADDSSWPIHPLWLRERSADPENLDPVTQQRLFNPGGLDMDCGVALAAEIGPGRFSVAFTDHHVAEYSGPDIAAEWGSTPWNEPPAPIAWSAATNPPEPVDWAACANPGGVVRALECYYTHGYVILSNVPARTGEVLKVARKFGFPRETNFGFLFDVLSVPSAIYLAYTSLKLEPHTDNPYRHPVPGIQLLHCITNETPGGLSTLVDGLAVAQHLAALDPESYAVLCRIAVRFRYADNDTELVAAAPLIELDENGVFAAIHFSPRLDFVPLMQPGQLSLFYRARKLLNELLVSDRFERRFKLEDGDLMMFDNRRLLHGRTAFDPVAGLRHLQGCYIDADGPRSLYRVLRRLP